MTPRFPGEAGMVQGPGADWGRRRCRAGSKDCRPHAGSRVIGCGGSGPKSLSSEPGNVPLLVTGPRGEHFNLRFPICQTEPIAVPTT